MGALTAITGPFSPGMDQLVQLVNQLNAILAATTTNAGALAVTGNFAVGSNTFTVAAASGNTALSGTLAVTGASTLTGNVSMGGTLGVTGAATLSSTAHIVGAATLDSTLAVTGASTLTGNVTAAGYILQSVGNGLTAAGTTRADALQLSKSRNIITTATSGTGVILPVGSIGMRISVFNAGASPVQVYASGSETIDTVAGATGVPLTNAKRADFFFDAANTWISAQLGVVSA